MSKSILLLLCCTLLKLGLHAQAPAYLPLYPVNYVPQKLSYVSFRAPLLLPLAGKTDGTEKSLVYLGPANRDTIKIDMGAYKPAKSDIQIRVGRRSAQLMNNQ
jgi:hypothetical protein